MVAGVRTTVLKKQAAIDEVASTLEKAGELAKQHSSISANVEKLSKVSGKMDRVVKN